MKANKVFVTLFATVLLLIAGCARTNLAENGRINVVASIYPLYEFTKAVGGDKVNAYQLLPAGADPHSWEPKPSDVVKISQSSLFVFIGAGLEPWMNSITGITGESTRTIEASKLIALKSTSAQGHEDMDEDAKNGFDPHVWLDPENDEVIVDGIAEELSAISPKDKEYFKSNAEEYKAKLANLDSQYKQGLESCKLREFVIGGHSSFGYLADRYNLTQVTLLGISTNAEPSSKKMAEIIDLMKSKNIRYVFYETIINPKFAQVIASEINGSVLKINSGHTLTPEDLSRNVTFLKQMDDNLNQLKTALECN